MPIDMFKFQNLLKDLQMMFCPNRELTDFQAEEYFKVVGKYPEFILKQARDWLIRNHKLRSLPLPSEIEEAIDEVEKAKSSATREELEPSDCKFCNGTGLILFEKSYQDAKLSYPTAKPCSCSTGNKYMKSFKRKSGKQRIDLPDTENFKDEVPF